MDPATLKLPIVLGGPLRFTERDALDAAAAWGFNCGPAAICAVLGLTPAELRPHMLEFEARGYTNPTLMRDVLERLGIAYRLAFVSQDAKPPIWPEYGLARIQWGGPWCRPNVPVRARYRETHWVGVRRRRPWPGAGEAGIELYDVNAMDAGGWIRLRDWQQSLAPYIIKRGVKRGDGTWWMTHGIEVWK